MFKFLTKTLSPSIVIALLLGVFSTFLVYKEQYEAAMAGAGVAVAIASSRKEAEESESNTEDWRAKYLVREIEVLNQSHENQLYIKTIEHQQELLRLNFEQQSKIKELEFKIKELELELKLRDRQLAINPVEVRLLSESQESMLQSLSESKPNEPSQSLEDNNNE